MIEQLLHLPQRLAWPARLRGNASADARQHGVNAGRDTRAGAIFEISRGMWMSGHADWSFLLLTATGQVGKVKTFLQQYAPLPGEDEGQSQALLRWFAERLLA